MLSAFKIISFFIVIEVLSRVDMTCEINVHPKAPTNSHLKLNVYTSLNSDYIAESVN